MLIPFDTNAAKKAINLQKYNVDSTLKVVGTITNPIVIEIPTIPVPNDEMSSAFEAEDTNWQQMTEAAVSYQMDSDNLVRVLGGALGWVRFNKPSGNLVGLEHKW